MNKSKENLSQIILGYLQKHPNAGDTLEGIVTWWLEQERIDRIVDEVAEALESLVKEGEVRVHKTQTGNAIYKIKKS